MDFVSSWSLEPTDFGYAACSLLAVPPFLWGAMHHHCLFCVCHVALHLQCHFEHHALLFVLQASQWPWHAMSFEHRLQLDALDLAWPMPLWSLMLWLFRVLVLLEQFCPFFEASCIRGRLTDAISKLAKKPNRSWRRKICAVLLVQLGFPRNCLRGSWFEFDATLGYPGEGPPSPCQPGWSLCTANIGSLRTSTIWKGSEDSEWCLQETRIGKNNVRNSSRMVQETGRHLFCGQLMSGILRANGVHTTMHGGTAVVASDVHTRPFLPEHDATGKYKGVFDSKRANAVWTQVTSTIRALIFSVYAKSGASACTETFNQNDLLLQDIFEIISQFGDIPVIVAGDFQVEPSNYPSVATAIHFHRWHDPLVQVDEEGNLFRPLTYSRDGTFTGHGDYCTSIDAILVNHVSFAALQSIQVLEILDLQHRPIRAVFNWEPILLCGDVHLKFAPLDTSTLPKPHSPEAVQFDQRARMCWDHMGSSICPSFSSIS